jgi:hypothetical protein
LAPRKGKESLFNFIGVEDEFQIQIPKKRQRTCRHGWEGGVNRAYHDESQVGGSENIRKGK